MLKKSSGSTPQLPSSGTPPRNHSYRQEIQYISLKLRFVCETRKIMWHFFLVCRDEALLKELSKPHADQCSQSLPQCLLHLWDTYFQGQHNGQRKLVVWWLSQLEGINYTFPNIPKRKKHVYLVNGIVFFCVFYNFLLWYRCLIPLFVSCNPIQRQKGCISWRYLFCNFLMNMWNILTKWH